MKHLIAVALIALATPSYAGKLGTVLQYSPVPDAIEQVGDARLWLYDHRKGGESVLVQLNRIALKTTNAERQAIIDNPRTFYDAGVAYIVGKGCKPVGTISKVTWNTYVVPFSC